MRLDRLLGYAAPRRCELIAYVRRHPIKVLHVQVIAWAERCRDQSNVVSEPADVNADIAFRGRVRDHRLDDVQQQAPYDDEPAEQGQNFPPD
jgi:hypothetical protein